MVVNASGMRLRIGTPAPRRPSVVPVLPRSSPPPQGKVYVSNLESQNHLRFEPVISGHIAENRISIYDGTTVTPVRLNPHIDYSRPAGPPSEVAASLAFPLGMEFTQDGFFHTGGGVFQSDRRREQLTEGDLA